MWTNMWTIKIMYRQHFDHDAAVNVWNGLTSPELTPES